MSQERKELFFCKLDEVFTPREHISPYGLRDKWRVVPVSTEEYSGNMLYAAYHNEADLTFSPHLRGWYKIYLHLPSGEIDVKLTSDPCFLTVRHSPLAKENGSFMTEVLWRCADMSDESIIITKRKATCDYLPSILSAIRFVPMSDEDVAAWQYEESRTDTKRIYATDDMHNIFYRRNYTEMSDWLSVVENYAHSDVEWISIEQIRNFVCDRLPTDDITRFAFPRQGDMLVQKNHSRFDFDEILQTVVAHGKKRGFKMSVSLRMGAWGMTFPYDQYYFDSDFMMEHPELRTVDRNGDVISAMSYAYPDVRDHMVKELVNMARTGCDAVTLIAHRGIPYVLFEKPVADRFRAMYGEDPYELPLDDPRLHRLHCDVMTEFFRAARLTLDENYPDRHVEIHLRGMFSTFDTDYIGFDVEQLAREGLVDAIISFPQRFYELLDGDIWQDGKEWRIDLDKYTDHCRKNAGALTVRSKCYEVAPPPYTNYKGELCGPATQRERVEQWNALEQKYGVKIYYEIMPRVMVNQEFKRRVMELYDCGAERIGLWDTFIRALAKAMWSTVSCIGHKDELSSLDVGEGEQYRLLRIGKIGEHDISRYDPTWGG